METFPDLHNRFAYHPPRPDTDDADRHGEVRQQCFNLASIINDACPDSREKSLAITHLEEAMMWANAAIARNKD